MPVARLTHLLAGCCLLLTGQVFGQASGEATTAFERQRWEMAIRLLESGALDSAAQRMLALALYGNQNFERAKPALTAALADFPQDIEVNKALLALNVADGDYAAATANADALAEAGANDEATLGWAKIAYARGDEKDGRKLLDSLITAENIRLAQKAAGLLIDDLMASGKAADAHEVAQRAIARDPDSFYSYRFSKLRPVSPANRPLKYNVGYRLEYDDNVALLPDNSGPIGTFIQQEDYRHVLTGDILYAKPFAENWMFFAEGHLSQSIYQDISELNFTGANVLVGIGQSFGRWGWRLPMEYLHDRFDGDTFRNAWVISPGVYFQLSDRWFLSLSGKLQDDDYEFAPSPVDNRSGDVTGGTLTLSGQVTDKFSLRTFATYTDYDTDGSFWQREDNIYSLTGNYQLSQAWKLSLTLQRRDMQYENVAPPNFVKQEDKADDIYLTVNHSFAKVWNARALISVVKSDSNIDGLDFDRNVYSLSVNREF